MELYAHADRVAVEPHPSLRLAAFTARFPAPLAEIPSPAWLTGLLRSDANSPLEREESTRAAVRDMLRHGGYKPTGRGKPAAEYLLREASSGELRSINLAVDACNAVSLHSGLPISVIDLDLAEPPFRVGIAPAAQRYVFNPAGQEIDLSGLLCLFDAHGPCANPIKDSLRTRTRGETQHTLSLVYAAGGEEERLAMATVWYRLLLERAGAVTAAARLDPG